MSNTVIPISCLAANSPYLKTLLNPNLLVSCNNSHTDIEQEEIDRGIYPNYQHFLGLKLQHDNNKLIKGILCVTDTAATMNPARLNLISTILNTVHLRCINELNQLRKQEKLTIARNIAVIDAENKLKFLADMSHEIR